MPNREHAIVADYLKDSGFLESVFARGALSWTMIRHHPRETFLPICLRGIREQGMGCWTDGFLGSVPGWGLGFAEEDSGIQSAFGDGAGVAKFGARK